MSYVRECHVVHARELPSQQPARTTYVEGRESEINDPGINGKRLQSLFHVSDFRFCFRLVKTYSLVVASSQSIFRIVCTL